MILNAILDPPQHKEPTLEPSAETAAHRPDLSGIRTGGLRPARGNRELAPDQSLAMALERAQGGDEDGFAILWRSLHPPLLRYLTSRGDRNPEDVAAETWLQVIRDLGGFSGGVPEFRAWLFTVARNRAIDQGRFRASRPAAPVADPSTAGPVPLAPSAEEAAADRAATDAALRLVGTLPPDQAEMVMLRVVAGLDVAAVAAVVGKSPGAVRVAVHRALKSLSQSLSPPTQALSDDPQIRSAQRPISQNGGAK